jgi:hypothetical protein
VTVLYSPDDLPAWLAGERHHHVVKAETVRDCLHFHAGLPCWHTDVTERVVSVVPPALETVECPDCGWTGGAWTPANICPSCDGKGQVTVLAVGAEERQYLTTDGWCVLGDGQEDVWEASFENEKRTVPVVAYQLVGDETLPVWDGMCDGSRRPHIHLYPRRVALYPGEHNGVADDVTDEPWAAGLAPGDLVIRWRAIRVLDEPIIDQACPECGGARIKVEAGTFPHKSCPTCNGSGSVPLVLTPGLCEVTQ